MADAKEMKAVYSEHPECLMPESAGDKLELLDTIVRDGLTRLMNASRAKKRLQPPYGRPKDPTPLISEAQFLSECPYEEDMESQEDVPEFKYDYGFNPLTFLADYVLWAHPKSHENRRQGRLKAFDRLKLRAEQSQRQIFTGKALAKVANAQRSGIVWGPVSSLANPTVAAIRQARLEEERKKTAKMNKRNKQPPVEKTPPGCEVILACRPSRSGVVVWELSSRQDFYVIEHTFSTPYAAPAPGPGEDPESGDAFDDVVSDCSDCCLLHIPGLSFNHKYYVRCCLLDEDFNVAQPPKEQAAEPTIKFSDSTADAPSAADSPSNEGTAEASAEYTYRFGGQFDGFYQKTEFVTNPGGDDEASMVDSGGAGGPGELTKQTSARMRGMSLSSLSSLKGGLMKTEQVGLLLLGMNTNVSTVSRASVMKDPAACMELGVDMAQLGQVCGGRTPAFTCLLGDLFRSYDLASLELEALANAEWGGESAQDSLQKVGQFYARRIHELHMRNDSATYDASTTSPDQLFTSVKTIGDVLRLQSVLLAWNDLRKGSDLDLRAEETLSRQHAQEMRRYKKKEDSLAQAGKKKGAGSESKAAASLALGPPPALIRPQMTPSLEALTQALPVQFAEENTRHMFTSYALSSTIDVFVLDGRMGYLGTPQARWLRSKLETSNAIWKVILVGFPVGISITQAGATTAPSTAATSAPSAPQSERLNLSPATGDNAEAPANASASGALAVSGGADIDDMDADKNTPEKPTVPDSEGAPPTVPHKDEGGIVGAEKVMQTPSELSKAASKKNKRMSKGRVQMSLPAASDMDERDELGRPKTSLQYILSSMQRRLAEKAKKEEEKALAEGGDKATDGAAEDGEGAANAGTAAESAEPTPNPEKWLKKVVSVEEEQNVSMVGLESGVLVLSGGCGVPFAATYDPCLAGQPFCVEVGVGAAIAEARGAEAEAAAAAASAGVPAVPSQDEDARSANSSGTSLAADLGQYRHVKTFVAPTPHLNSQFIFGEDRIMGTRPEAGPTGAAAVSECEAAQPQVDEGSLASSASMSMNSAGVAEAEEAAPAPAPAPTLGPCACALNTSEFDQSLTITLMGSTPCPTSSPSPSPVPALFKLTVYPHSLDALEPAAGEDMSGVSET